MFWSFEYSGMWKHLKAQVHYVMNIKLGLWNNSLRTLSKKKLRKDTEGNPTHIVGTCAKSKTKFIMVFWSNMESI